MIVIQLLSVLVVVTFFATLLHENNFSLVEKQVKLKKKTNSKKNLGPYESESCISAWMFTSEHKAITLWGNFPEMRHHCCTDHMTTLFLCHVNGFWRDAIICKWVTVLCCLMSPTFLGVIIALDQLTQGNLTMSVYVSSSLVFPLLFPLTASP